MSKIEQVKAELTRLDTEIEELNRDISDIVDEMEAAGELYEEGPALEREQRLRAATARRYLLQQRRHAVQFDLNCREAWGENWDAVAGDNQKSATTIQVS